MALQKHRRQPGSPYRYRDGTPAPKAPKSNDIHGWVPERLPTMAMPQSPMFPAVYDDKDVAAINALFDGRASAEQQRRGMAWIVFMARTYDETFHPDAMLSSYMQGMRRVGRELVKLGRQVRPTNPSNREQG